MWCVSAVPTFGAVATISNRRCVMRGVLFWLGVLGLVGLVVPHAAVASVAADPIPPPDNGVVNLNYSGFTEYSDGGPFTATVGTNSFLTFCVETTEYFYPGDNYLVQSVSAYTASDSGNTVASQAEWLYAQYRLANAGQPYNAPGGIILNNTLNPNAGADVQAVVWAMTTNGGGDPGQPSSGTLIDPASLTGDAQTIYDDIVGRPLASNSVSVGVFNPIPAPGTPEYPSGADYAQSMLYLSSEASYTPVGDFPNPVPEPTTIVVWTLLGGVGITLAKWRRKRAA
jgi:hypothetical protein